MKHLLVDWPCDARSLPDGDHLLEVPDMAAARRLLGPASDAARAARGRLFWSSPSMAGRSRLRLGMHDRGEAHFITDMAPVLEDASGQRRHLPLHLRFIKRQHLALAPEEELDVTSSHLNWPGLHPREELYVMLHVEQLRVAPGAVISVHGNMLVLCCGQLTLEGQRAGGPHLDIRILGTRHAAFASARRHPAGCGARGSDGAAGQDGKDPVTRPTALGPLVLRAATPGEDGADGRDGGRGTAGQPGGMAMLADLRFAAIKGPAAEGCIRVLSQAGQGQPGGRGGDGGNGGAGGKSQLRPGRGGSGGRGGDGGHGGHGGLASNVFVEAPGHCRRLFNLCPRPSIGGEAGEGGAGGTGAALSGAAGAAGRPGLPGRSRPSGGMFFIPAGAPSGDAISPNPTPKAGVPSLV